MIRLDEVFDIYYGVNLEVVNCEIVEKGMPFVSRQSTNNGIVCHVKPINIIPNPEKTLSIAASGSVLSTYYHKYQYYSGRDVYIAQPKHELSDVEMLFYCYVIEQNKYRYNYGRQANRTLKDILVPSYEELPYYINKVNTLPSFNKTPISSNKISNNTENWKWFVVGELFECSTTSHTIQQETIKGNTPFVTRSALNNGVSGFINDENLSIYEGNCITIGAEGIVAFFQPKTFATGVKVYTIRHSKMNVYNAMFIITILNLENYRYNYGNARILNKIQREKIKLPVAKNGEPDWEFMENYIKSLPYSACL